MGTIVHIAEPSELLQRLVAATVSPSALEVQVAQYRLLTSEVGTAKVRIRSIFRQCAIDTRGINIYARTERSACEGRVLGFAQRKRFRRLCDELDELLRQQTQVREAMLAEAQRIPAFLQLQAVDGVGPIRAAQQLARFARSASANAAITIDAFDKKREWSCSRDLA